MSDIQEGDIVQFLSRAELSEELSKLEFGYIDHNKEYKQVILSLANRQFEVIKAENEFDIRLFGLHDHTTFTWRIISKYLKVVNENIGENIPAYFGVMNYNL